MAVFFTSDLHLGHENVLASCNRPFADVSEMNETLIRNWNRKVGDEDEVYILGDLAYRSDRPVRQYLDRLRGQKHLIIGNHERWLRDFPDADRYFLSVSYMLEIELDDLRVTLCHYPLFEWNGSRHAANQAASKSWLIHGHLHNRTDNDAYRYIREKMPCALNAGVDINRFEPVTFEELIVNNNVWYGRSCAAPAAIKRRRKAAQIEGDLRKARAEIRRKERLLADPAFLEHAPADSVRAQQAMLDQARAWEKSLEDERSSL